jgi:hypothetical protein
MSRLLSIAASMLVLDEGRLLALTFDGSNSRVIDLLAYTAGLPVRDFFLAPDGK